MNIFEEATKLGNEHYNRDKLLAITSELIARFRPALRAGYPPELMPRASRGRICPPTDAEVTSIEVIIREAVDGYEGE